jgi:serine/threonine protein kinase
MMPIEGTQPSDLRREVEILRNMHHPNIIRLVDYLHDETLHYIVLEHSAGGDLFDKIGNKQRQRHRDPHRRRQTGVHAKATLQTQVAATCIVVTLHVCGCVGA